MEEQKEELKGKNKKTKFKKFLIIYVAILTVLAIIFLGYIADSLIKYEKNQIENYMEELVSVLKKASQNGKLEKYINISNIKISEFEKEETTIEEGFEELLNNNKITYKIKENSEKPIYNIYANERKILEVELDDSKKQNRLGLLAFNVWKIKSIKTTMEDGLYTCNIIVPNNCKVYVNQQELSEEQIVEKVQNEGLEQISKYIEIPYIVKYAIPELLKKPEIKVLDVNGELVECKQEGNTTTKELDFITVANEEEAKQYIKGEINISAVAKDWSLYLTDDLQGRLHGYDNIGKYLIKDSDLDKFAYKWATGVDITFVSSHTLLQPTFTDLKISNFEIYNENAFSCEVYLQKNLRLTAGGKRIEDKMNERMYFVCYDEQPNDETEEKVWKLVNMQSVADNNNN